ncbi:unnamed protein product, partial [Rotaria magnacalcarata]
KIIILITVSIATNWGMLFDKARQVASGTVFLLIVDSSINDHPGDQKG